MGTSLCVALATKLFMADVSFLAERCHPFLRLCLGSDNKTVICLDCLSLWCTAKLFLTYLGTKEAKSSFVGDL